MSRVTFPSTERPRASIILLAWKRIDLLLTCLRSLSDTLRSDIAYEVVVVLQEATPSLKDALRSQTEGVRLVESQVNLGFGGGCNLGVSVARGEYLVLLNDDCVVAPRWLDWLVATADANPLAGAVSSLILFPDGRIQEAGAVVWADGSATHVGREAPGDSLEWHFVRQVDYDSACSLLVTRRAWDKVGGFDSRYHPIYYEDVDLCLAIRDAGYQVLFEPRSRLWHHESASAEDFFKRFLFRRNQKQLQQKWAAILDCHIPAEPSSPAAVARAAWRARGAPRRVLIIDDRVPESSSGTGRMLTAALDLAASGYAVSVCPATGVEHTPPDALVSAGVAIVPGDIHSHLACAWVNYEVVIVCGPHNFKRFGRVVRRYQSSAVLIYDCETLSWRCLAQQATLVADTSERARFEHAAATIRALEERIVVECEGAVAASKEEAELLARVRDCCPISLVSRTHISLALGQRTFDERIGVVYVADWLPRTASASTDGLRWFAGSVLPLVRESIPWIRVHVAGAHPPPDVLELADANLIFEGHVPDLTALFDRTRVAITPRRFGAGVEVTTVQALQNGVPVVSTSCGTLGIDTHGLEAIDVSDDPRDFARMLVTLLTDRVQWQARRSAIADVLRRWKNDVSYRSWSVVIAEALGRRHRGRLASPAEN